MRRNATKVAAVVMSLAVTMTSVNLPTTAAAATKKVKLKVGKKTLTVGQTTTLKVTKGGKAVKATFKSSNAKVAKVVTKSGKSTKIKALKKGTAKITATYAKKKYTCKITVKAKKVTTPTTAPTVEPTVAPTATPVIDVPTTAPATDAALETKKNVDKIEFRLTNAYDENHQDTVLVGTNAYLKARALDKDGKPVANVPITVSEKVLVLGPAGNTMEAYTLMTDSEGYATFIWGYEKTKDDSNHHVIDAMRNDLIQSSKLTATVAGSNVATDITLKFAAIRIESEDSRDDGDHLVDVVNNYEDKDRKDVRKGLSKADYASRDVSETFVKNNATGAYEKRRSSEYVSSQKVSNATTDNSVTFSSAAYLVLPSDDKISNAADIVVPCNEEIAKNYGNYEGKEWKKAVEDVSAAKLKYATVVFDKINISAHTQLKLQAFLVKDPKAEKLFDENNLAVKGTDEDKSIKTEKFGENGLALNNYSWQIPLNDKEEGYLVVRAIITSKGQVNVNNNEGIVVNKIVGVYNESGKNTDIVGEKLDDVKVSWSVDNNVSYTIPADVPAEIKDLLDAQKYYDNGNTETSTLGAKKFTYKYTLPSFPHTGNAIVTVYNQKGQVYTYYSLDTVNNGSNQNVIKNKNRKEYLDSYVVNYLLQKMDSNQKKSYDNGSEVDVVYDDKNNSVSVEKDFSDGSMIVYATSKYKTWKNALNNTSEFDNYYISEMKSYSNLYELSAAETKQLSKEQLSKFDADAEGKRITVDSTTTGISHIVGTIETTNKDVKIDAANQKVYTSVQWNPINVNNDKTAIGYAFKGQNIKVVAQLKDTNGNDVNISNQSINFEAVKANGSNQTLVAGQAYGIKTVNGSDDDDNNVKVISISNQGKTDAKGQVEMVVSSEDVAQLLDIVATTNSGYNVSFSLNGKDTNSKFLELYWLDLDLLYTDCVTEDNSAVTSATDFDHTEKITPDVGGKWSYAVQLVSKKTVDEKKKVVSDVVSHSSRSELKDHTIENIKGVETKVSMLEDSTGSYTTGVNSVISASEKAGEAKALLQIVPNSVKENASVEFKKGNDVKANCYYAGSDSTSIDKRFRFNITWKEGELAQTKFLLPTGKYVHDNNDNITKPVDVYFQVADTYGNPLSGREVVMTATDKATLNNLDSYTATTDNKGMVKATLSAPAGGVKTTIVSATVDGKTYKQAYEWRKDTDEFVCTKAEYNESAKQLVLTFNDEVYKANDTEAILKSVLKENSGDTNEDRAIQFSPNGTLTGADVKTFNAKDVSISGRTVKITLPDTFKESISNQSKFSIDLSEIEVDGVKFEIASAETGARLTGKTITIG